MACEIDLDATGRLLGFTRFQLLKFIATGLCLMVNGEQMACDFDSILAESACCDNDSEHKLLRKIAAAICQLVESGGGGGGSGCVTCVSTPPVDPPDITQCACSVRMGIGVWVGFYWVWDNGFTDTWVQVPGGP